MNLTDYASPVMRFNHAYQLGNVNDKAILEVSTNGTTWTALKTFTGINTSPHWIVEEIDLSAYEKMAQVYLRFNVQRANATGYVYWYVDDVYINAWPAVATVSFTPPARGNRRSTSNLYSQLHIHQHVAAGYLSMGFR